MDFAYDHINQDAFDKKDDKKDDKGDKAEGSGGGDPQPSLNEEIQDAYKAFQSSPWGMKLGGFLSNAAKQGQSVYQEASKEVAELGQDAAKGFTSIQEQLATRTRGLSINTTHAQGEGQAGAGGEASGDKSRDGDEATPTDSRAPGRASEGDGGAASYYLDRFRNEAAKRLKDLQKAEDAADEALLRFGGNIRDFLREAVTIAPPAEGGADGQAGASGSGSTVLFESKDASGKRVIHASRQDAQLHVVHTSPESFSKDPATDEYAAWAKEFDVDKKTGDISDDLAKYPELRSTMEKLVPDQVPYADFWRRYYFLRHGLDAAEARRRDLLKAAAAEDDVGWGDDDDDDDDSADEATKTTQKKPAQKESDRPASTASSTTIAPPQGQQQQQQQETEQQQTGAASTLKPVESRKSNDEKSQADSEASYDVVGERSGVPSQAPSSPKESRKGDDSDDDWE